MALWVVRANARLAPHCTSVVAYCTRIRCIAMCRGSSGGTRRKSRRQFGVCRLWGVC